MEQANTLGVGAMGFGGKASLIGCKVTAANRLPASFFVSVAYDCWAFRRLGIRLDAATGAITKWLYRDPDRPVERMARGRSPLRRHPGGLRVKAGSLQPWHTKQTKALVPGMVVWECDTTVYPPGGCATGSRRRCRWAR